MALEVNKPACWNTSLKWAWEKVRGDPVLLTQTAGKKKHVKKYFSIRFPLVVNWSYQRASFTLLRV